MATEAFPVHASGRRTLQAHVTDGILQAATVVFAQRGRHASMADVAEASGVSRSTLYRYFANREALFVALYETALSETIERIRRAGLEGVSIEEGIARLARALVSVGNRYLVLIGEEALVGQSTLEQETEAPMAALFKRGQAEGLLRADLPVQWLELQFANTVLVALRIAGQRQTGDEQIAAVVVDLFLRGAREPDRRT